MKRRRAIIVGAAGMAAVSSSALAQGLPSGPPQTPSAEAAVQADAQVAEVIVTAQKREQRLLDVPQSVSVVSAKLLEQTHSERLEDFFTRVPSASIQEAQAGGATIILRGINTGGAAATVATYVDEVPYGSATGLANAGILAPDLDPNDLSRVEVLRGPQGTLYGANSLGGLIKYVTILPSTDRLKGTAEVGVETVDHGSTGWSARGALNLPLGDNLAARVSGFYRDDPGFIDDPKFGRDINDGRSYGGRVSVLYKPTNALTMRATASVQDLKSNGSNTEDVDFNTLKPTLGDLVQSRTLRSPQDIQYQVYNATESYDFGPVTLLSSTSYGVLTQNAIGDDSALFTQLLAGAFGTIGYSQDQQIRQRRITQELRLASKASSLFEWTLGGYYSHESNRLHQAINGVNYTSTAPLAPFAGLAIVDLPSTYSEYAGFANGILHLSKMLDLTVGGRYSHNDQNAQEVTSGPLAGAGSFSSSSSDGVFTYSVAPTFKPRDDLTFYARIASGYRPGGPNVVPSTAPNGVPRQYSADTTTNYEVGVRSELFDKRVSTELTAFYIDWNDIQLVTIVSGYGINANGGSARSQGLEASVTATPITGLTLSANGAYVDAFLTKDTPAILGGHKGDLLPYAARFASTIAVDYEHPLGNVLVGVAGLSWRYTGPRESGFDAALGQRRLPDFNQVDAHAGVTFGRYRLDLYARNLTDSRGIVSLGNTGTAPNGAVAAGLIRPRSVGLSLGVRY